MRTLRNSSRFRWVALALVFLATAINYLDRQTLSVAAPLLKQDFAMSSVAYSHVLFCFLLAYTVMNGLSGVLIDRVGTKAGYAIFVAWWSVSAALHGLAHGVMSLGVFRFLLGMGEAGNWPAAVKVVAENFAPEDRAFASGIFNSGSSIGAILAPPLIAWIILSAGWRTAFVVVGALGLVWLAAWLMLYRGPGIGDAKLAVEKELTLLELLRNRFVWTFTLSKVFFDPVWYFYTFWFPEYLHKARMFDLAGIGRLAWIPFFVAGLGSVFGGLATKLFLMMGMPLSAARKSAVTLSALMMTLAIPASLVSSNTLSIALVSVAMAGYTTGLANMLAMPGDAVSGKVVASVYGLASMGSGFGGMAFTLITGWLVDRYSFTPVFFLFGLIPLISSAIQWGLMPRLGAANENATTQGALA